MELGEQKNGNHSSGGQTSSGSSQKQQSHDEVGENKNLQTYIHCDELMANFSRVYLLSSPGGSEYIVPTLLAFIVLLLP